MAENSSSSWDDLIKQLGAEPAPDALERKRSAIETSFQPPAVSAPPARAKGGDWNALAGELGIELPPEPEPPAPAAAPSPPQPPREAPVSRSAASLESTFAGIEPIESMFEEIIEEEIADVDFSEGDDFDDDDDETLDRRELQRPGLSGEAARSAFEALFEAGSFSALPPVQQPQSRPPAEARRGPDWRDFEEVGGDPSPVRVPSAEPTRPPSDEAADEDLSDEQNRPKRRRRRRRGRGRDRADASSADEPDAASAGPADSDEPWQQPLDDDDLSQEEAAADEGDDQLAGEEKRTRRRRPRRRHRKDGRE
ncbi:MAG: hypothetical protein IT424_11700, partial [Pirellulales bacterium]|nr:hypothetical protein [Pirellulales bacterium]